MEEYEEKTQNEELLDTICYVLDFKNEDYIPVKAYLRSSDENGKTEEINQKTLVN